MVLLVGNLTSVILVLKEEACTVNKTKKSLTLLLEEYQLGDFRYELGFHKSGNHC